jgi:hypothetical protein
MRPGGRSSPLGRRLSKEEQQSGAIHIDGATADE